MSTERHPNFHAVNFTTQIMSAYYESLRGGASKENAPDISNEVVDFVCKIEETIDTAVERKTNDQATI